MSLGQVTIRATLWIASLGIVSWMAYWRWRTVANGAVGADFGIYLDAARNIAAGKNPYLIRTYIYPPPLALALAPFAHVSATALWRVWVAVVIAAPLFGLAVFLTLVRGPGAGWLRPVIFAAASFTLLDSRYYPMFREVWFGQSDTILFAVLIVSAVAASRGAARTRGAMIGLAGLVKVWPWATAIGLLQSGVKKRWTALGWALAVALVAPLTALVFGWSGLVGFVSNDFSSRTQNIDSDSVWSVPQMLFSHTTLGGRPITVSSGLETVATVVLLLWVLGLGVVALRSKVDAALTTWNVLFCVILVLPVAHRQYALLVLPLVWWWWADAVTRRPFDWRVGAVAGLLTLWWLNQTVAWPYNGSSVTITAVHFCVPFFADLIACTVSVVGGRLLGSPPVTLEVGATPVAGR